jgi:hypothetical protein
MIDQDYIPLSNHVKKYSVFNNFILEIEENYIESIGTLKKHLKYQYIHRPGFYKEIDFYLNYILAEKN